MRTPLLPPVTGRIGRTPLGMNGQPDFRAARSPDVDQLDRRPAGQPARASNRRYARLARGAPPGIRPAAPDTPARDPRNSPLRRSPVAGRHRVGSGSACAAVERAAASCGTAVTEIRTFIEGRSVAADLCCKVGRSNRRATAVGVASGSCCSSTAVSRRRAGVTGHEQR